MIRWIEVRKSEVKPDGYPLKVPKEKDFIIINVILKLL